MKVYGVLVLSVFSVALLISQGSAKDDDDSNGPCSHNFINGTIQPYDRLLNSTEIDRPRKTNFGFPVKRIEEVLFPPAGKNNTNVISAVRVFDLVVNGTGGFVDKLTYGQTMQSVVLRLKSQKGEGYKFLIEIWGH